MTSKNESATSSNVEADLIERAGMGDRSALASLYQLTSGKLLAVILKIVKSRAEAEDVLQDVFIKIWNRARDYRRNRGSPGAWILTIGRNAAIDRLRRKAPTDTPAAIDPDDLIGLVSAPGEQTDREADADHLRWCLRALEDNQSSSIRLAFFEGLSHSELADRVGAPLGTVKARIRRGIASLRSCLERRGRGPA